MGPYVLAGVAVLLIAGGITAFGFLVPLPDIGIHEYNVATTVSMTEIQAVALSYYNVNSASSTVSGGSTLFNTVGIGITPPSLSSNYKLTVCVGSSCTTASETKFLPSLQIGAKLNVEDTLTVGGIAPGTYTVTATLYVSGTNQGSATTSVTVA